MTLQKYFSYPSFSYYIFFNPTHKTKYDLTVFISLFQGSESCSLVQGPSNLPVDLRDLNDEPCPRFPVQGHILSFGGDVLRWDNQSIKSHEKRSQASHSCKRFGCLFHVLLKVFLEVGLLVIPSAQISPDNKGIKSPENI